MLLAVDIGNTQTVVGLFAERELAHHWRIATNSASTSDEIRVKLLALLRFAGLDEGYVDAACLASVVPELTEVWCRVIEAFGVEALVVRPDVVRDLSISYVNPSEIGADRLADAVAAIEQYGAPVVVVDLGTATNIEVIDREGRFLGGIIAPGLMRSADALFSAAARIARVNLVQPDQPIGTSTQTAVQSGLVYGEVDRIDGLVRRVFDQLGYEAPVVATGGIAYRLAPLSRTITVLDQELTLKGLRCIYERNHTDTPASGAPCGKEVRP